MGAMASQITSLTIVYSTIYSGPDQRKYYSSASLAFVWGIHRGPVNSPHKGPVTRKKFPFDDVIMSLASGRRCDNDDKSIIFKLSFHNSSFPSRCGIAIRYMLQDLIKKVKIGSDNVLVPSGKKPQPYLVFTQIYVDICYHNGLRWHFKLIQNWWRHDIYYKRCLFYVCTQAWEKVQPSSCQCV